MLRQVSICEWGGSCGEAVVGDAEASFVKQTAGVRTLQDAAGAYRLKGKGRAQGRLDQGR